MGRRRRRHYLAFLAADLFWRDFLIVEEKEILVFYAFGRTERSFLILILSQALLRPGQGRSKSSRD